MENGIVKHFKVTDGSHPYVKKMMKSAEFAGWYAMFLSCGHGTFRDVPILEGEYTKCQLCSSKRDDGAEGR